MAKDWGGKTYNEDWEPIDAMGNKTGDKDWAANRDWNAQNDPGQINNFSPAVLAQTGGIKPAPNGQGGGVGAPTPAPQTGGTDTFAWDNPGDFAPLPGPPRPGQQMTGGQDGFGPPAGTGGIKPAPGGGGVGMSTGFNPNSGGGLMAEGYTPPSAPQQPGGPLAVTPPNLDAAALLSQLQGPQALGQVQGPANLGQLGAAPTVAAAGPASAFGQSVQGSIQAGLADPTVDPNSPAYKAQVDAFQRNAQRSAERMRGAAAQRANAQGTLGSGGFDAGVNRILQNQGSDEANFEAQLMQSELDAGRQRQARAQQLGAGLYGQEQAQGLTERLANQSGALAGMGMNNQRDLANQGAGLQMAGLNSGRDVQNQQSQLQTMGLNNQRDLTSYGANQQRDLTRYGGSLQAGLANQGARMQQRGYNLQKWLGGRDLDLRGQQVGNQNNQFYDQLGQQLGLSTAEMNQRAMLALLGGG